MSDLFKHNAPRMSDDEDRRAWERVRQAQRPAPWWAALWARPAVRYGLPAVAVEQPASTHAPAPHVAALERTPATARTLAPATPAPGVAPAPVAPAPVATAKQAAPEAREFAPAPRPLPVKDRALAQTNEAQAQAMRDQTVATGGAAFEAAPRPTALRKESAAAPAPGNGLAETAPAPAPPTRAWGAVKSQYRADSLAPSGGELHVRGGRGEEYMAMVSPSALSAVAAALVR